MKTIKEMQKAIHENAKSKGFYEEPKNTGEMIALMHSELSEALEADRNGRRCENDLRDLTEFASDSHFITTYQNGVKGTIEEEMADIVIRVMDFCEFKGIDLEQHIKSKMRYNSLRQYKHGKKY